MKSKHTILCIILILAFWILLGCRSSEMPTLSAGTSITSLPPTESPTETPFTLPFTQTLDPTAIQSPYPTLPRQDALEHFVNSLESDDTCSLPCWLSIRPGETPFKDAQNIFSQYSSIASLSISPDVAFLRVFFPDFENATHDVAVEINPTNNGQIERMLIFASTYQDKNGPIDYKNPNFQKLWQRYFLPGIFSQNGVPEKIFLDTTLVSVDTTTSYPFVLWVVYPKQGFLIRYEGQNLMEGENIKICPMQSRIEIKIWGPRQLSYEEFIQDDRASGSSTSLGPQPIESVTRFSLQSFHEMHKSGDINSCFETPVAVWPH